MVTHHILCACLDPNFVISFGEKLQMGTLDVKQVAKADSDCDFLCLDTVAIVEFLRLTFLVKI